MKDEGTVAEIDSTLPEPLLNPEQLCGPFIDDAKLPRYTVNHAEVVALESELKELRKKLHLMRSSALTSKCRVQLPFAVAAYGFDMFVIPYETKNQNCRQAMFYFYASLRWKKSTII